MLRIISFLYGFLYSFSNGSPGLAIKLNNERLYYLYKDIIEILISKEPMSSHLILLSDKVNEFSNDEFKIFLMLTRHIFITITKINFGYISKNNSKTKSDKTSAA